MPNGQRWPAVASRPEGHRLETRVHQKCAVNTGLVHVKPTIHFTDKLYILESEKGKAIKIYGNEPNGFPWLEFRLG
ncbi:hypothetical protein AVEN_88249-1, partial [Araneus ventricosus]